MNHALRMAGVGSANLTGAQGLSLFLVTILVTQAFSQTIPIDDFNDGWSMIDSTVGRPYGPGVFEVRSGAYHLGTTGDVPVGTPGGGFVISTLNESSDPLFSDGFLRTKVRADTEGTLVSLMLRLSGTLETGLSTYQFQGGPGSNGPFSPSGFGVVKFERNRGTRFIRLVDSNLTFDTNQWYNVEAGAVGNEMSMKVWRDGEPEPESPQLMFSDSTLSTGTFGVGPSISPAHPKQAQVSATFDDLSFTFPPPRSSVTLAPYDIYLWESPVPVPQIEGPFFTPGSPEKPDMRGDVATKDGWPELRITGQVTDLDGEPIPGLKLDFWQVDDQGSYDNSGGYDLRGHLFTDDQGNYELWTVMPANYESFRTRHLHAKLGGENLGFDSWAYTTQLYFPEPYDNDINADGTSDKVIVAGVPTDLDVIALAEDFLAIGDVDAAGAEFSDLASNILTLNNDPLVDGYFDTTLDIMMPHVFQRPVLCDFNDDQLCDPTDINQLMTDAATGGMDTDLNGDGIVDDTDRDKWLVLAGDENGFAEPLLVGDSDLNGTVDAADLNALALSWRDVDDHNWTSGNFTVTGGSGVNAGDLNALALNWRASSAAASQAVPELSTFGLMLLALTLLMGSRMRRTGS